VNKIIPSGLIVFHIVAVLGVAEKLDDRIELELVMQVYEESFRLPQRLVKHSGSE
jgi:hypothetical protein